MAKKKLSREQVVAKVAAGESLRGASLAGIDLSECGLKNADLRGADLTGTDLTGADLTGSDLRGAKMQETQISSTKLVNADLRNADLRKANFYLPDLAGALLQGANFEGTHLSEIPFGEDQFAHAGRVGPKVRELNRVSSQFKKVKVEASVAIDGAKVHLEVDGGAGQRLVSLSWKHLKPRSTIGSHGYAPSVTCGLITLANTWGRGELDPLSVKASGSGGPLDGKELKQLAMGALCEVFGIEEPSPDQQKAETRARKARQASGREELLGLLRGGAKGISEWNRREVEATEVADFRKADLAGCNLEGARFVGQLLGEE
jgi:hypothetical protein